MSVQVGEAMESQQNRRFVYSRTYAREFRLLYSCALTFLNMQIIVTIRALAQGTHQTAIGSELIASMSQPSVSRSVREVVRCINEYLSDKFVKFPTTEEQRSRVKDG